MVEWARSWLYYLDPYTRILGAMLSTELQYVSLPAWKHRLIPQQWFENIVQRERICHIHPSFWPNLFDMGH